MKEEKKKKINWRIKKVKRMKRLGWDHIENLIVLTVKIVMEEKRRKERDIFQ